MGKVPKKAKTNQKRVFVPHIQPNRCDYKKRQFAAQYCRGHRHTTKKQDLMLILLAVALETAYLVWHLRILMR